MRTAILASLTALPFIALVGCKQLASDEGAYCEDTATVLAMDEVSELGFSGADVLANIEGAHTATMIYSDDSTAELTVDLLYDGGEVRFVHSEAVYPDGITTENTMEAAILCDDRVEIDLTVDFASDDGLFDESWQLAVRSVDDTTGEFDLDELDPTDFTGSYDFMMLDPAEWDHVETLIHTGIDVGGLRGEISELGDKVVDDNGPDSVAMAQIEVVAAWGANAQ